MVNLIIFVKNIKICVPFKKGKEIAQIDFSPLFDFSIALLRRRRLQ